jgi:hypothetical protein
MYAQSYVSRGTTLHDITMSFEKPTSVLIFRIGSIGDTVVALPCFHAIARAYPRHRKVLLTNAVASARASSVESVLKGSGLIDGTVYFPAHSLGHAASAIASTAPGSARVSRSKTGRLGRIP